MKPSPMPVLLAELLVDRPVPRPPYVKSAPDPDSIADWYTETHGWTDLLIPAGWSIRAGNGDEDGSKWRHPAATSACSATIRHGCLFVYSPKTPFEVTAPSKPAGYTRFHAYAVLHHDGDESAAAGAARQMKNGNRAPRTDPNGWAKAGGNQDASEPTPDAAPWEPPVPLGAPTPPPFPAAVFPRWLDEFVVAVSEATQTPLELPAMMTLAALATAAGGRIQVEVRRGWVEPTNLFIATAMPPGSRKSAVVRAVTAPLEDWERRALDHAMPEIADAATRKRIAADLVRQAEAIVAKAKPDDRESLTAEAMALGADADAIEVPPAPRLLADDATPEALVSLLADQRGRIGVLSAEGDVFDMMAGRYSKVPSLGVYLKGHAGDSIRVDRKGRSPEHIERPALTLGITVQPDVLRTIAGHPGFRGRGLLARFLYAFPDSNVGHRQVGAAPVPKTITDRYSTEMEALATTCVELVEPVTLTLSADAQDALLRFEGSIEPRLASHGDLGHIADWAAKLVGAAARIAALLHLAERLRTGWVQPITVNTVEVAVKVAEFLIPHALTVFDFMRVDDNMAAARRIITWIDRTERESFTRRECHQAHRTLFPKVGELDPVLEHLEELGYIRRQETSVSETKGRPPSPTYLVNPNGVTQKSQKTHNSGSRPDEGTSEAFEDCETQNEERKWDL